MPKSQDKPHHKDNLHQNLNNYASNQGAQGAFYGPVHVNSPQEQLPALERTNVRKFKLAGREVKTSALLVNSIFGALLS